jgi:hypothetical protein
MMSADAGSPRSLVPDATTPVDAVVHGTSPRGLAALPGSRFVAGRFGRMFRQVPIFSPTPASLTALAQRMVQAPEPEKPEGEFDEDENPDIPAGYTYLGQFIDHDITFDPVSSLQRQADPDALVDFRTPALDLDNVYGRGPADQPYLYQPGDPAKLLLGRGVSDEPAFAGPDVPRTADGRALIGDPRNDENLIVSQLQSVFLRLHNAVVDRLRAQGFPADGDELFKEAQRLTRWHYQWVVVHDFLGRHIVGDDVVEDILVKQAYRVGPGTKRAHLLRPQLFFYHYRDRPFIPVEFSVAAYRFGHSMVRPSYFINDRVKEANHGARRKIFSDNTAPDNLENLNGFRPLPPEWGFQWRDFYELDPEKPAQRSYKIDDELVDPLGHLPPTEAPTPDVTSLAERNLLRALRLGVPSGQAVARAMGIAPLSDEKLGLDGELVGNAPLWYYVLREAAELADGRALGPVGGRIVAEVLIGLLAGDPLSYLNVEPNWRPEPPMVPEKGADFGMPELIRFAGADIVPSPTPAPPPPGWTG